MTEDSMKIRLKYVVEDVDRHGNVRLYFRRNGKKIRLPASKKSPDTRPRTRSKRLRALRWRLRYTPASGDRTWCALGVSTSATNG
jgi:hypothetical protein